MLRPAKIVPELVRIGGSQDGSYLVPDIDIEFDGVISPGVGGSFSFETAIVGEKTKVLLIDGTVEKPNGLPNNFVFLRKMLGVSNRDVIDVVSLESLIEEYFLNSNSLVLQMDIEGGEYEVLDSVTEKDLSPFALVLVEFHQLQMLDFDERWNQKMSISISKLKKDFLIIHTHPNNAGGFFLRRFKKLPKVVETTWVRKSLVGEVHGQAKLPHPLDRRNDTLIEDLSYPHF